MPPFRSIIYFCVLAIVGISRAHPGHDVHDEAARRSEYLKHDARSLTHCALQLKARGHEAANLKRRQDLAQSLRQKRGLGSGPDVTARNVNAVFGISHHSSHSSISLATAPQDLFSDNSSCILQPEVTEGPYYISGELIRSNIRDDEEGIPLVLDIQIIDTTNCKPMPATYVDIWHCNATGVYSGVVANGNGDSTGSRNLNNNAFRGLQKTDETGFVQFQTIFPGHYVGRTNHVHVLTHSENAPTFNQNSNNNALSDLVASHVGQIFFDQNLQAEVEAHEPYTTNQQALTSNAGDFVLASEANTADPMVNYVLLGDRVTDGILGWISIGIDPTQTHTASARGTFHNGEEGGMSA